MVFLLLHHHLLFLLFASLMPKPKHLMFMVRLDITNEENIQENKISISLSCSSSFSFLDVWIINFFSANGISNEINIEKEKQHRPWECASQIERTFMFLLSVIYVNMKKREREREKNWIKLFYFGVLDMIDLFGRMVISKNIY